MKKLIILLVYLFIQQLQFAQTTSWKVFTNTQIGINSSAITCIAEDKGNNIWIGTNGEGIFKYDWNGWINFDTNNSPLTSNYITSLAIDANNSIWIGTFGNTGGLTKFDGYNWKTYNIDSNTTYDIQIDNDGSLWMGSYWKGLIHFDGDTNFTYYNSSNTNLNQLSDEIIAVNIQLDSVVLCGTELGGAAEFNKATTTWEEYFSPVVPIDLVINSIIVDANKNRWFAGIQYVSMLDSNSTWQVFDYDSTNNYDYYHDIIVGDNNSLLFSSDNGLIELDYSNGEKWVKITPPDPELTDIGCDGLFRDQNGNIWIGYNNGFLAVYNPSGITNVESQKEIPKTYSLFQNYPNPFNPTTTIKYSIPTSSSLAKGRTEEGFVTLKVYDVLGREIKTLVNKKQSPGTYTVEFNAANLPSGLYFYKLTAGSFSQTKKMLLLK